MASINEIKKVYLKNRIYAFNALLNDLLENESVSFTDIENNDYRVDFTERKENEVEKYYILYKLNNASGICEIVKIYRNASEIINAIAKIYLNR